MSVKTYKCRSIVKGRVEGEAIVSREAMCFYLCDPKTGEVIEKNHPLKGRSIAKKILVLQSGKGSSVVQVDGFYQLSVQGNLPAGIVVREIEPVLVSAAVVMETPMVDRVEADPFEIISDGDWVEIDTEREILTVTKKTD
jgi:predicted aconitase with swiveling domain